MPGVTAGWTTSGAGTNASVTVTVAGGTITQVDVTAAGSGFAVDDTIRVNTSVIGGLTNAQITLVSSNFYPDSTYGSTNFDLDNTDQTELILNILAYSGVVIRDPQVVQTAQQMVMQEEANQKS